MHIRETKIELDFWYSNITLSFLFTIENYYKKHIQKKKKEPRITHDNRTRRNESEIWIPILQIIF